MGGHIQVVFDELSQLNDGHRAVKAEFESVSPEAQADDTTYGQPTLTSSVNGVVKGFAGARDTISGNMSAIGLFLTNALNEYGAVESAVASVTENLGR